MAVLLIFRVVAVAADIDCYIISINLMDIKKRGCPKRAASLSINAKAILLFF
jgi:hypothetical protein